MQKKTAEEEEAEEVEEGGGGGGGGGCGRLFLEHNLCSGVKDPACLTPGLSLETHLLSSILWWSPTSVAYLTWDQWQQIRHPNSAGDQGGRQRNKKAPETQRKTRE